MTFQFCSLSLFSGVQGLNSLSYFMVSAAGTVMFREEIRWHHSKPCCLLTLADEEIRH